MKLGTHPTWGLTEVFISGRYVDIDQEDCDSVRLTKAQARRAAGGMSYWLNNKCLFDWVVMGTTKEGTCLFISAPDECWIDQRDGVNVVRFTKRLARSFVRLMAANDIVPTRIAKAEGK